MLGALDSSLFEIDNSRLLIEWGGRFVIFSMAEIMSRHALHTAIRAAGVTDFSTWLATWDGSEDLRIDLSRVEFVEFGTLAQVLVMIEAAARAGIRVTIDLPTPVILGLVGSEPVGDRGRRRARCRQFLFAAGFVTAAALPHLVDSQIKIRNIPDGRNRAHEGSGWAAGVSMVGPSDATTESGADDRSASERTRVLPFRWIAPDPGEQLWHSEGLTSVVAGLRDIGLPVSESQLLADAVLVELIENVATHARGTDTGIPPHALVGAVAFKATILPRRGFYHSELGDFAQWCSRSESMSVRIIVADSGAGLVTRLRATGSVTDIRSGDNGAEGWTDAEKLSLWAMDPARAKAGALRGLWRAREAVGSFRGGAFLAVTADAAAGYTFIDGTPSPVRLGDRNVVSGTLFDITVLPTTSAAPVVKPQGYASSTTGDLEMQWLRFGDGRDDEEIFQRAQPLVSQVVLLTVDGGADRTLVPARLATILRRSADLAATAVVVLVVTGYDPVTLSIAIQTVHAAEPGAGAPFLLIDETGNAHWSGGTPEARSILERLCVDPTMNPTPAMLELLVGLRRLIRRTDRSVTLTLDPSTVVKQLERMTARILDDAVASDLHPGVLTGAFRTPNLHLTRKWVMVDRLLDHTVGSGIAAFLLAQKAAAQARESLQRDTQLVLISDVIQGLATMLAADARMTRGIHNMSADDDVENAARRLPAGTRVVLVADILLTENSVVRRLKPLLRHGIQPIALIVPLDARQNDGPVSYRGRELPVISLARVSHLVGTVDPDEPVVDIDPIFRTPVEGTRSVEADHHWLGEEFLRACNALPSVIGLGHVRRPPRHFTAYFDVRRLLDSGSRLRDEIIAQATKSIEAWLVGAASDSDRPLAICHVGSRDSYAGRLAMMVGHRLKSGPLAERKCVFVEVPRVVTGPRYAFPDLVKLERDGDVILVDWGSFDATTITQMVRLAAGGGARRIFAVVLLSQLTEHEEQALAMWRSVERPGGAGIAQFRIRFLTTLGITPLSRSECSLCDTTDELRANARYGMLPREVAVHAENLATSLRILNRDSVANRGIDAFGGRAAIEDAVAYVRLRSMFVRAQRSTSAAQDAADELAAMADAALDQRGHAVIRLLAAEQHWLDLLPIRLSQCFDNMVSLATAVAAAEELEERLRLQAVIVLASAAPDVLVERLPDIWRTAQECDELLLHLLYQLWTMVRPGGAGDGLTNRLVLRVRECLEYRSGRQNLAERDENLQYLLTRLLQTAQRRDVKPLDLSLQEAWAGLRDDYLFMLGRHSGAEMAAINLLLLTSRLPTDPGPLRDRLWETLRSSWNTITAFMDDRVLRYTASIAPMLSGAFVHEHLSRRQRLRLRRLTSPSALLDVGAVESQIYRLRGLDRDDRNFAMIWKEVNERTDEWYRTVLASGGPDERIADLAELIQPCPAHLVSTVRDLVDLSVQRDYPLRVNVKRNGCDEVKVFCHRELLRSAIQQIIDNAIKPEHRAPTHVDSVVDMEIDIDAREAMVLVHCRNTGTKPTTLSGKGIVSMRRKLQDFQATITPITPRQGWAYEIELALEAWSPGLPGAEL